MIVAFTFMLKGEGLASYKAWMPKERWQWLVGLVMFGLMVKYSLHGLKNASPGDFASFWWAGKLFTEGKDIYIPITGAALNVYLPLHAILMAPLALLPINFAFLLWQIGQLLALWASFRLLEHLSPEKEQKICRTRFWLTLLLALPPLLNNWFHGQYNHWLLLGTLITLKWLSEGREWMSGIVMGFLLSIKPFQLLGFLLLTVLKGLWRFVLVCIGIICFGVVLLPSLLWGFKGSVLLLTRWHERISYHAIWFGWESRSLTISLYRLLTPCNVSPQPDHPITVNVLNFPSAFALGIVTITALFIFTLVIWHCRNPMTLMDKQRFLWETSLFLTTTLLLSTRTEMHHGVMLVPTFLAFSRLYCSPEKTMAISQESDDYGVGILCLT